MTLESERDLFAENERLREALRRITTDRDQALPNGVSAVNVTEGAA